MLAYAGGDGFQYDTLGKMPVLADGRIKPLDSLARVLLQRIYGHANYEGQNATQWLAHMVFKPGDMMNAPIFTFATPQAAAMMGLEIKEGNRYSFVDVASVLPQRGKFFADLAGRAKNSLAPEEAEVVRVYNATNDFAEVIGTFSLLLPLPGIDDSVRAKLGLPAGVPVTCSDLLKERVRLTDAMQDIIKRKGMNAAAYKPEERALSQAVSRLSLQATLDEDNALVRVIPPTWEGDAWQSPWGVIKSASGSPQSAALLRDWRALAMAYQQQDAVAWNQIAAKLGGASAARLDSWQMVRLDLEFSYNRFAPLTFALCAYGIGLLLVAVGLWRSAAHVLKAGQLGLALGVALHATALVMRMLILMRPPVSTLYESLLFVSFVVMAASLWMSQKQQGVAWLAGAATAFALLLIGPVFAGDGDTLGVLVAVLNTNFWLATHVVCITTGYACALVTGAIAHIYLFNVAVRKLPQESLKPLMGLLYRASLIALCFTATGTMLGGIWADQSWGRFWGWDPKENGALLIVLWLIWLLHGRVAGQLGAFSFAALMAFINVVVGIAWIGVNLLSVGLHSYGFTDSAANGLMALCGGEFLYVGVMTGLRLRQKASAR